VTSRWRPPKPPDEARPARAGTSASGTTSTAADEKGGRQNPPTPPPLRRTAEEWLPPLEFLPPETPAPEPSGSWDRQRTLDDLTAAQAAGRVYESMDDLAAAFHARLATLTDMPAFSTWERAAGLLGRRAAGPISTCGRTTRQSRGSRRAGI
jgi:hypothetical protein